MTSLMRSSIRSYQNWRNDMKEKRYGGLTSILIKKVMDELGIEQKTVDKIQSIVDNVDITKDGDQTVIEIKLSNIRITIDK